MTSVVRLADHLPHRRTSGRNAPNLHFTRPELNRLLALYAGRVAKGEWRDYAISLGPEAASFAVFRHTQEFPLFVISKMAPGTKARTKTYNPRHGQYVVLNRQHKLSQGHTLEDALDVFNHPIRLVSG